MAPNHSHPHPCTHSPTLARVCINPELGQSKGGKLLLENWLPSSSGISIPTKWNENHAAVVSSVLLEREEEAQALHY